MTQAQYYIRMCMILSANIACILLSFRRSGRENLRMILACAGIFILRQIYVELTGDPINTVPIVGGFFLRTLLTFLFCYGIFVFGIALTGSVLSSLIVSGIIGLLPLIAWGLVNLIGRWFILGFNLSSKAMLGFFKTDPLFMTAFYHQATSDSTVAQTAMLPWYLVYIAEAVVLFVLAFVCMRVRKQERAGDSFAFGAVKAIFIFAVSVLGMLAIGALLLSLFRSEAALYVGFVLGFVIGYVIARMIADRSFRIFRKMKAIVVYGAVMVVLYAGLAAGSAFDVTGYATYSPAPADVKGVYAGTDAYWLNNVSDYDNNLDTYFIHDPNVIAEVCALQKGLADNHRELLKFRRQEILDSFSVTPASVNISYELANGKIVTRFYDMPADYAQSAGLFKLFDEDEVILAQYYSLKAPEKLSGINLQYTPESKEGEYPNSIGYDIEDPAQIASLVKALQSDIVADVRNRQNGTFFIPEPYQADLAIQVPDPNSEYLSGNTWITYANDWNGRMSPGYFLFYSCENTKQWLKDNGYWK